MALIVDPQEGRTEDDWFFAPPGANYNDIGGGHGPSPYPPPSAPGGSAPIVPSPALPIPGMPGGGGGGGGWGGIGRPQFNFADAPEFVPPVFRRPTFEEAQKEPGYQFRLDSGRNALEGSAAARGVLRTGGTLK